LFSEQDIHAGGRQRTQRCRSDGAAAGGAWRAAHLGLCGDTTLAFYDALFRLDHGMEHILTRDERSAAYMADAYARVTGKVGVCEGPSGGGATYIWNDLDESTRNIVTGVAMMAEAAGTAKSEQLMN
jgi:glyoxylate carboligase